jgi:hypothetical protein
MNQLSSSKIGIFLLVPIVLFAWFRTHFFRKYCTTQSYHLSDLPSDYFSSSLAAPNPYPLIRDTSIETFQLYLSNGSYTSEELVRTFLARISEVNDKLHAVAEINPDAINIARHLDRERRVCGPRRYVLEFTSFAQ